MIQVQNAQIINIKSACIKARGLITFSLLAMLILGCVYFIYWTLAMSDDIVLKYTEQYFLPLASFFFPSMDTIQIYRSTSTTLFELMIPTLLLYYAIDKFEENIISKIIKNDEKKAFQKRYQQYKQQQLKQEREYDAIRKYSICISIDYETDKGISELTKTNLNKYIFKNIINKLNTLVYDIEIDMSNILVISSRNFKKYDYVYDVILEELDKMEKTGEEKYGVKLTPSITTDAVKDNENIETIKNNHLEIKSFNLNNKSLATEEFLKKYRYIQKGNYETSPIGEYLSQGKDRDTYELSTIYKN